MSPEPIEVPEDAIIVEPTPILSTSLDRNSKRLTYAMKILNTKAPKTLQKMSNVGRMHMAINDTAPLLDPSKPLPKDKKELLHYWKEQIRQGLRYRLLYGRQKEWKIYKNAYRNFFAPNTVPVNIIYAVGRSLIPQVTSVTPTLVSYLRNQAMECTPDC